MASENKERTITFFSQLKSEFGQIEIKFDFKESDLKSKTDENKEGSLLEGQYNLMIVIDEIRQSLEQVTGQRIYTKESSFYEELPRK